MTHVSLINVYLEGFRAGYYDKLARTACPYNDDVQKATYWRKGHDYATTLSHTVQGIVLLEQPAK